MKMAISRSEGFLYTTPPGSKERIMRAATPEQIARFQRHLKADTTPGNPPWYKFPAPPKTFKFKPGAKPVYAKDLDELRIEDETGIDDLN
jgi:hypothetical protein